MSNDQSEQLFKREQVEQNIEEMSRKLNLDRSSEGPTNLPSEILEELENSSSISLQKNIKEFVKNLPKYDSSEWANSEIFNKEFHRELKRKTVDALQSTNAVYKGADRLIIARRAATGFYEECQQFLKPEGSEEQFFHIMEGIRQLAVYSYTASKTTKSEARTMATKALRLPDSIRHLEEESSDKVLALGKEEVEKSFKPDTNSPILRNAVGRQQQSFKHSNRGFGGQQRYTRGRGTYRKSFLDATRANYTRRPKAPINLNKTATNANVFPRDNGTSHHIK
ncbi:hypothetical protein RMATCC62417_12908 [Rhizopus microsporus]|nr:hypothetical protein RMATCC62417_12908 [Rhizopus microsporus]